MSLTQNESVQLFELKKYQVDNISIDFPLQGQSIEIELQNEGGRIGTTDFPFVWLIKQFFKGSDQWTVLNEWIRCHDLLIKNRSHG